MSAPGDFDPYLAWLDIKPTEHPVDHYRLLGVDRFEADATVIQHAADARMSHVRQFQTGPRGRFTQRLLNDLSMAKLCLLNPNTRATYDAVLMAREAASKAHAPLPPPVQESDVPSDSRLASAQPAIMSASAEPTPPPVADSDDNEPSPKPVRSFQPSTAPSDGTRNVTFAIGIVLLLGLVVGVVFAIVDLKGDPSSSQSDSKLQDSQTDSGKDAKKDDVPDLPQKPDKLLPIEQEADGSFSFPATLAELKGDNLERINTGTDGVIANWSSKDDSISWKFNVTKPGFFKARLEYAAGATSLGSKYVIEIGDRSKDGEVRVGDSPGSQVTDEMVLLIGKKGLNQIRLRALEIQGEELMRFRSLKLVPR